MAALSAPERTHTRHLVTMTAIYKNIATNETYKLGMETNADALALAWKRLPTACKIKGWNVHDVVVVGIKLDT